MTQPAKTKRKCSVCKENPGIYKPAGTFKVYCSAECGSVIALELLAKKRKQEAKEFKKEIKRRKQELLTTSDWIKKAQVAFNGYIRQRDKDKPCISCGRFEHEIDGYLRGGKWDCGHYRSRGAAPELRFEPLNAHKQCKSCNGGSGKYTKKNHTVSQEYRSRLIERIGPDKVEWLEGPHEPKHYRVDDLKNIHDDFKQKVKDLK